MSTTTTGRYWPWLRRSVLPAAAAGVLALTSCSSSGSGGTQPTGPGTSAGTGTAAAGGTTVTIHDASGHAGVLATPDGKTLYESDQENGTVLCKSSACTAIWTPLTVPAGQMPTAPGELTGTLSTIKRPDGKMQVALDGKPLYTFSFDHSAGQTGGDGQKDSFDGTDFTWQFATAAGGSGPAPAPATSAQPSTSSGGYNY